MYNWRRIKEELIINIRPHFTKSVNPRFTNFDEGIAFFEKLVLYKSGEKKLDGLRRTILPALNEIYITDKGSLNALKIISQDLEAYLKKIIFLKDGKNYVNDHSKTLVVLMDELDLNLKLKSRPGSISQFFNETTLASYHGEKEFLEDLCRAYITRNQVHNCPNWDLIEVFTQLKSVLIVYVYATLKHLPKLQDKINTTIQELNEVRQSPELFDAHTKMMYDFICFGTSTTEIKKQVIVSYVLHYLSHNKTASLNLLHRKCNTHFKSNLDLSFYRRVLENLVKENRVKFNDYSKISFSLTDSENTRLKGVFNDFEFKEQMLVLSIKDALKPFNLEEDCEEIILKLKELFEKNYNIDFYEIFDKGIEVENNSVNLNKFLEYLTSKLDNCDQVGELFTELMIVCEENDFLMRVGAGVVFSKINNYSHFQNYFRQQKRKVYLDTQIILHALCFWHQDDKSYDNVYYKITRDLISFSRKRSNIELYTSQKYIAEAAYHLKEGLFLIPFEELEFFKKADSSSNVFYQFYYHIKSEFNLEEGVETFADFLQAFDLDYEDAFDINYMKISTELISQFLNYLGIKVFEPVGYNSSEAFEIFKNCLNMNEKSRNEVTIRNDARMMTFLSHDKNHINEPIFVTWDNSFYDARKEYIRKYKGSKLWHLFSPSKLLNHLSLIDFEINSENLTNEFLSIFNASDSRKKSKHVLDSISLILDIKPDQRGRYLSKLKELSKNKIFEIGNKPKKNGVSSVGQPIEALIKYLTHHYNNKSSSYGFNDFKRIFSRPELFESISDLMEKEFVNFVEKGRFSKGLTKKVDKHIEEAQKLVQDTEEFDVMNTH